MIKLILKSQLGRFLSNAFQRYPFLGPSLFFFLGFVFDIVTIDRIDNNFMIIQQGVFLLVLAVLCSLELVDSVRVFSLPPRLDKLWSFRDEAAHFLFGSLLSAYTIFYFKSSSFSASFFFLLFILVVLIANEFSFLRRLGVIVRFSLWLLCLASYLSYVVPVYVGSINVFVFMGSILVSFLIVIAMMLILMKWITELRHLLRNLIYPAIVVNMLYLSAYLLSIIPPVPLSIQYIAVFHKITKESGQYILHHEKPWWRFWQSGDQQFRARPGDTINLFVRVFSPSDFKEKIWIKWSHYDARSGWVVWDRIPIEILGGREEGFRGIAKKQNFTEGEWRVQVETADEREIGRYFFDLEKVAESTEPRVLNTIRM